jgi:hypothetical protein
MKILFILWKNIWNFQKVKYVFTYDLDTHMEVLARTVLLAHMVLLARTVLLAHMVLLARMVLFLIYLSVL